MVTMLLQGDPGGEGGKKDVKSRKERLAVLLVHMHNAGFVDQLSVKSIHPRSQSPVLHPEVILTWTAVLSFVPLTSRSPW